MGRGARATGDTGGLPVGQSEVPDWVLLVQRLQSLAPDLKVEEPRSELAETAQIAWSRGIGGRGGKTRRGAASRGCCMNSWRGAWKW